MTELHRLQELLKSRSITFGDFVLSSGQHSSYYVDARKTTMSGEGLDLIGRVGLSAIRSAGWPAEAVGGLTMGADPVAYAIARRSVDQPPILDAFSVRKAAKEHGTKRQIEGNFHPGARVIVVEDVITSGGSAVQAIDAIQAAGGIVVGLLAVVDRLQGGRASIEARGIEVLTITTILELGL